LPVGEFDVSNNISNSNSTYKILVVGAGGLGCEILKDLAMCACGGSGGGIVRDVVVIDLGEFHTPNYVHSSFFMSSLDFFSFIVRFFVFVR
jgi:molybdopterin/thiamine biosynthesis adenylyltransferase